MQICHKNPQNHGSLNVPIEHHPTIRYMVYNGYYKVMSNIPKMGHLPTPENIRPSQPHTSHAGVKLHLKRLKKGSTCLSFWVAGSVRVGVLLISLGGCLYLSPISEAVQFDTHPLYCFDHSARQ